MKATTASSSGNGVVFLTCQRISSSRSAARAGTLSNRTMLTRAIESGTTRQTRPPWPPAAAQARSTAAATTATSAMFGAASAPVTAPSGSGSTACAASDRPGGPALDPRDRDPARRDVDGDGRRRLLEERRERHSTNVTLLISRSVVRPSMTRSTADSRRKRIP